MLCASLSTNGVAWKSCQTASNEQIFSSPLTVMLNHNLFGKWMYQGPRRCDHHIIYTVSSVGSHIGVDPLVWTSNKKDSSPRVIVYFQGHCDLKPTKGEVTWIGRWLTHWAVLLPWIIFNTWTCEGLFWWLIEGHTALNCALYCNLSFTVSQRIHKGRSGCVETVTGPHSPVVMVESVLIIWWEKVCLV